MKTAHFGINFCVSSILCCFLFLQTAAAQDTLEIRDAFDASPIEDAQLNILDASGKSIIDAPLFSDAKGRIILPAFNSNSYFLIEHINYHTLYLNFFQVKANKGRLTMMRRAIDLTEVVVVGASKIKENLKEVPSKLTFISQQDISIQNPQTSADALSNSGEIYVQKSQMGGGSPILRGFEANKVLIVVDGIRMNNAIYRSGHLQNVITIDNSVLDHIEVYHGPATIMYGTDALGGVMHFFTKKPQLYGPDDKPYNINAYTRFSTANFEKTAHTDFNFGGPKFGTLSSFTYTSFEDLRAGRIKLDTSMARSWNRYFYADYKDSTDIVSINLNPNVQVGTAYSQMDLLQKFRYHPNEKTDLIFNVQYSTSSNIPRYDQLTEGEVEFSNGQILSQKLEFAEWYYGPQNRFLASLHAEFLADNLLLFNTCNLVAAFQKIDEDRITRKFGDPLRRIQAENVFVYTFNADFTKKLSKNSNLLYGAELAHNYVQSIAETFNIRTEETSTRGLGTRYPDGGSTVSSAGTYANYRIKLHERANIIAAGRYNFTHLGALYLDTILYDLPYTKLDATNHAIAGSLSLAWDMGHQFQFNGIFGSAFRAPNLDDMAKIRAKGNTVTIPNPDLQPEKGINMEVSISKQFSKKVKASGTFFHTYLYDAIAQSSFKLNGVDTMYYDGRFRKITAMVNIEKARVWGLFGSFVIEFNESASMKGSVTYTKGTDITSSDPKPMSHIPPLFGQFSFNYHKKAFSMDLMLRFNGAKELKDYANSSEENLSKALPNGTPAWFTINVYTAYKMNDWLSLNIGLENLLDWHYRPYASGVSAPGQNVILALRANL